MLSANHTCTGKNSTQSLSATAVHLHTQTGTQAAVCLRECLSREVGT